jgi:hypothetical protein
MRVSRYRDRTNAKPPAQQNNLAAEGKVHDKPKLFFSQVL